MAIGFDTPSKRKNEGIDKAKESGSLSEAMQKTQEIGSLIVSEEFNRFNAEERVHILQQFALYNSKVQQAIS